MNHPKPDRTFHSLLRTNELLRAGLFTALTERALRQVKLLLLLLSTLPFYLSSLQRNCTRSQAVGRLVSCRQGVSDVRAVPPTFRTCRFLDLLEKGPGASNRIEQVVHLIQGEIRGHGAHHLAHREAFTLQLAQAQGQ